MNIIRIAFFLLFFSVSYAQQLNYNCNRLLEYTSPEAKTNHSFVFNDKSNYPIFRLNYSNDNTFFDAQAVSFKYKIEDKIYDLDGKFRNEKYILIDGYGTFKKEIKKTKIKKTNKKIEINGFNCIEYKAEIDKTKQFAVASITNLNDNVDYNPLMKLLCDDSGIELPKLKKGEIIVQLGMIFDNGKHWITESLVKSKEIEHEFIISKENLNSFYNRLVLDKKETKEDLSNTPSFCHVESHQCKDKLVDERISHFLGDMCEYYQVFGKNDTNAFYDYFEKELVKRAKNFKKNNVFTQKQSVLYEKILRKYLAEKNTSKLDQVKEHVKNKS